MTAKKKTEVLTNVRLRPDQRQRLRALAYERAATAGRLDVSSLVREAVDQWLARRGRGGAS